MRVFQCAMKSNETFIEKYEALLTEIAVEVKRAMTETGTSKEELALLTGKDVSWVNDLLEGFSEDFNLNDLITAARSMGYTLQIGATKDPDVEN